MKRELSDSQARLVAGGGLYDHLPPPMFPPRKPPSPDTEEIRRLLEQLSGPRVLIPGVPPHKFI